MKRLNVPVFLVSVVNNLVVNVICCVLMDGSFYGLSSYLNRPIFYLLILCFIFLVGWLCCFKNDYKSAVYVGLCYSIACYLFVATMNSFILMHLFSLYYGLFYAG